MQSTCPKAGVALTFLIIARTFINQSADWFTNHAFNCCTTSSRYSHPWKAYPHNFMMGRHLDTNHNNMFGYIPELANNFLWLYVTTCFKQHMYLENPDVLEITDLEFKFSSAFENLFPKKHSRNAELIFSALFFFNEC